MNKSLKLSLVIIGCIVLFAAFFVLCYFLDKYLSGRQQVLSVQSTATPWKTSTPYITSSTPTVEPTTIYRNRYVQPEPTPTPTPLPTWNFPTYQVQPVNPDFYTPDLPPLAPVPVAPVPSQMYTPDYGTHYTPDYGVHY